MIIVLDSPNAGLDALARGLGGAEIVEVDITDMRSVRAAVQSKRPSAVVSTVWRDWRAAEADPEAAFRYDGEAAINMAAAALEFQASACLLSVADVFGQGGGPFDESTTPQPASEFAEAARRAEVFFSRAMRDQGLVVRSGPWFETIAHELQHEPVVPGGVRIQPIGAEALGRFVAGLLASGVRGVAHAVPAHGDRPAVEVYREAAQRMGRALSPPAPDTPLAPAAILRSPSHAAVHEVAADAATGDPAASSAAGATDGDGDDVVARHGGAELRRYEGSAGTAVALELGPPGATLWLRAGKGVVERADRDDAVLGSRRAMTVDGPGELRFAPVTDFELFVLRGLGSSDADASSPARGADDADRPDGGGDQPRDPSGG